MIQCNRISKVFLILPFLIAAVAATTVLAQRGDRDNDQEQREVWREMDVPPAPPLSPAEALKSFRIAPGFRIELVASEPMVQDPVAITWDADGRLWVVEMRGYMPNVDGTGEDVPNGRISVLEDTDGDGKMDKSTVFLDGLVMPRAVAIVEGGVLVAEPPTLWFCKDTDGDLQCDEKEKLTNYAQQGPVEHTDNGLLRGVDNWIYSAKSSRRFQWKDGKLIESATAFRGQWGIAQDNYGRLYSNTNSSWLHADLLPANLLNRNPNYETGAGLNVRVQRSQSVQTIRVNPGVNRGYRRGTLRNDGRLANTTGVSGVTIYRGDYYGDEYIGNAFIPEPSGNVVGRFEIESSGVNLAGQHVFYPDPDWGQREFLASTDERFRPVSAATGPDGCVYLVDLYRGILQHKVYVTSFLRKQIVERELDKHIHLGRIYRIVREDAEPGSTRPLLTQKTNAELIKLLSGDNGWIRDQAQQLLVERPHSDSEKAGIIAALQQVVANGSHALGTIHALYTLDGLHGSVPADSIASAVKHADPQVRVAAWYLAGPALQAGMKTMPDLADEQEVLVAAMFSLSAASKQEVPRKTMVELLASYPDDTYLRSAAVSGLHELEAQTLRHLMEDPAFAVAEGGTVVLLRDLAEAAFKSREPQQITVALGIAATQPPAMAWRSAAILGGANRAMAKAKPITLPTKPAAIDLLGSSEIEGMAGATQTLLEKITWKDDTRVLAASNAPQLTEAEKALAVKGKALYMTTCFACHQPHGKGQAGLAPSLIDSPWVLGKPEIATRIVLQGIMGPLTIDDEEWNLVMPGHSVNPAFTDEAVAGLLTYIRTEWGNEGTAVAPSVVEKVRKETAGRFEPWTVEQLEKLK